MKLSIFLQTVIPFTEDELSEITSCFEKQSISKNEMIVREGQICQKLYFIEHGIGRSFYLNKDGKEITQWFFAEGKFMTSLESFFQQSPSLYYLEMLDDSILYSISRSKLDMLFTKFHNMEKFGRLLSTEMLTKAISKLSAVQFQTAKERYDYMLSEFPNISYRVPLGSIASYLGMTQETLSRIRRSDHQKKPDFLI
ncbi:Crp/Fnr family transcriptional regulator [Daejeonella oryzae]|uniref:Crp/Fnr family transcriptional regulator n=1 Tax=Daejeonella oryzae TaxID=1122943 RepID=UPI0004798A68|nr:Crp/Fnr family transcriptional regulator [Daejeonella oryzae]